MRITVVVTDAEYLSWKVLAGAVPLSRWIRGRCNEQTSKAPRNEKESLVGDERLQSLAGREGDNPPEFEKVDVAGPDKTGVKVTKKPRGICKHGIAKGWNCWQCGGMAVIE